MPYSVYSRYAEAKNIRYFHSELVSSQLCFVPTADLIKFATENISFIVLPLNNPWLVQILNILPADPIY
jgi:hypothetical protein